MRKHSFIAAAGILTLWLGGCGGDGGDTTVVESPSPAAPTAAAPTTPPPATPATAPFAQPTTAASPGPVGTLPPDLISSTNPDQRFRSIQRNRPDPFALVPIAPVIQRSVEPVQSAPTTPPPAPITPGELAPIPQLVPNNVPPPPPLAQLARAVQVTGIVQIGNTVNAIIKAPNEPSSRYVRVGQYLSNGQILVKRIDVDRADPVVVFEQDGVEVVVAVGEGGPPTSPPGTPTASATASPQLTASRPF